MHTLSELLSDSDATLREPHLDPIIEDITIDPDKVRPGTLFIARTSWYEDTHLRLPDVLARQPAALIISQPTFAPSIPLQIPLAITPHEDPFLGLLSARFFDHPTRELRVYGVTGTNGKTSVTYLLEHLLTAAGERVAVMGTVDFRFGARRWIATNTTPDGIVLQRFARVVSDLGATALVLEISSHGLEIQRTAGLLVDVAGFTNLSRDHLDFHATFERYRAAKRHLFDRLLCRAHEAGKTVHAVACVDDGEGFAMLEAAPREATRVAVTTRGHERAHISAQILQTRGAAGLDFELHDEHGTHPGHLPLPGRHNLANATLALSMVACTHPEKQPELLVALEHFPGIPGRMQAVVPPGSHPCEVFVDYAHSPDAVERVLEALRTLEPGRETMVVLGCGGDRDPTKRAPMAKIAAAGADHVFLTSDNPRSEDPEAILDAMQLGLPPARDHVHRITDRRLAIERAVALARARGALLVIAGKGHERYQEIGGARYAFDDVEEARRALEGTEGRPLSRYEPPPAEPWLF